MAQERLTSDVQNVLASIRETMPGVTSSFTYFGKVNSVSTGHSEDKRQFSLNYMHGGAPKFWVSIPKEGQAAMER
jgi:hypothetical protein